MYIYIYILYIYTYYIYIHTIYIYTYTYIIIYLYTYLRNIWVTALTFRRCWDLALNTGSTGELCVSVGGGDSWGDTPKWRFQWQTYELLMDKHG